MTAAAGAEWAGAGIYAITNTRTGEQYVGSAAVFGIRWGQHVQALRAGKHPNPKLQAAWIRDGADAFRFDVLETVAEPPALLTREQAWIDDLRPVYNMRRHIRRPRLARPVTAAQPTTPAKPAPRPRRGSVPTLRAWRRYVALTQKELAERAHVSRPTIARAENGGPVSLPHVRGLAKGLGITVQQLYQAPDGVSVAPGK